MFDVVDGLVQELSDVVVVKPVNDAASVAIACDQTQCPQKSQLVRYRWLFHPHRAGQLADRARGLPQPGKDHQSIWRSQSLQGLGDLARRRRVEGGRWRHPAVNAVSHAAN